MGNRRNVSSGVFAKIPGSKKTDTGNRQDTPKNVSQRNVTPESTTNEPVTAERKGVEKTFKNWFHLMMINWYLPLFVIFMGIFILELIFPKLWIGWIGESYAEAGGGFSGAFTAVFISIFCFLPPSGVFIIVYKGFYQFWQDQLNGTSR